jgi:hypothetical protein
MRRLREPISLAATIVFLAACGSGGPSGERGGCTPSAAATMSSPRVVNGQIVLTEAQNGQAITVPAGTIVQVDLVTASYGPWSMPESSAPKQLQRLSGSTACDGTAQATFRADGSGRITAKRGNREVTQTFSVSITVSP